MLTIKNKITYIFSDPYHISLIIIDIKINHYLFMMWFWRIWWKTFLKKWILTLVNNAKVKMYSHGNKMDLEQLPGFLHSNCTGLFRHSEGTWSRSISLHWHVYRFVALTVEVSIQIQCKVTDDFCWVWKRCSVAFGNCFLESKYNEQSSLSTKWRKREINYGPAFLVPVSRLEILQVTNSINTWNS